METKEFLASSATPYFPSIVTACPPLYSQQLAKASAHFYASTHPPILTVLWFCKVIHVTTHHAKLLCGDLKVSLYHRITQDVLRTPS